jgi:hypothetical protein
MTEHPADTMRRAAEGIREKFRPDHAAHSFWSALADWLDAEARLEFGPVPDPALKVARAWLREDPAS